VSAAAQPPQDIRAGIVGGVAWKTASAVTLQLSRIVTSVILAHLLLPGDYGLASMALVASMLVFVFADVGLGSALVQREEITEEDRCTVFWTSVGVGAVLTLIGVAASGLVADFFGQTKVGPLFAVFSISFLLTSISATQVALFTREMDFRALELRQIVSYLAGAVVGIATAAAGMGAWAIIFQQLTISLVGTVLLTIFSHWRPRLCYSRASLRRLGRFGGNVFGSRLLFYGNRNADNILIGRFLGSAALGSYAVAYNVMLLPFSQLAGPLQEVLFPAFARMQEDVEQVARLWLRANRVVGAITIPAFLGLAVVAQEFVTTLLGPNWVAAIPVMRILCIVGLLQSLQRMNSSILEARNQTGILLRFSIVAFVASISAFIGGLHWGIVGVAAAYAIVNLFLQPYYAFVTCRTVGTTLHRFAASLSPVAQSAAAMAAAILVLRALLVHAGMSAPLRLIVLIAAGAIVYVPLVLWRDTDLRRDAFRLLAYRRARGMLPRLTALEER
jgi:O-antigen/teichoic acid export membrane protein